MAKYISISQSSKNMANHRNHKEIPRDWLEEKCYGNKFIDFCPYKLYIENCPASCPNYNQPINNVGGKVDSSFSEDTSFQKNSFLTLQHLNQVQKFYKKYGEDWRR
jgi:hypothetical protein